jgi:hypothetical protein
VVRLAGHLTAGNADELLNAAAHKNPTELEKLLAERFPQPDVATRLEALAGIPCCNNCPQGQLLRTNAAISNWRRRAAPRIPATNMPRGMFR